MYNIQYIQYTISCASTPPCDLPVMVSSSRMWTTSLRIPKESALAVIFTASLRSHWNDA